MKILKRRLDVDEKTDLMTIGKAAKDAGIPRQSVQYYLMIGLIEPTMVTPTGRRLFDKKTVERIRLVKKLNESGYPLLAIKDLFLRGGVDVKGD